MKLALWNIVFCLTILQVGYCQNKNTKSRNAVPHVPTKYAFIVGIQQYDDSTFFNKLCYPSMDADRFADFLLKGYIKGIRPENIVKITNDSAKVNFIEVTLSQWMIDLQPNLESGDCVFIYWSGHGALSQVDQSLACFDSYYREDVVTADGELYQDIPISLIKSQASRIFQKRGVKVFLIIDACRTRLNGVTGMPDIVAQKTEKPEADGDLYFYSATGGESSWETPLLTPGSGVFTYFLLLGLQGAADNLPPWNTVTVNELDQYLTSQVTPYVVNVLRMKPQKPKVFYKDVNQNIVLTEDIPNSVKKEARRISDSLRDIIHSTVSNATSEKPIALSKGFRANEDIEARRSFSIAEDKKREVKQIKINYQSIGQPKDTLYDSIIFKISKNQLLEPKCYSAYDYYELLEKSGADTKIVTNARLRLVIALQDKVKNTLDLYIQGKLSNTKKSIFDLASEELSCAYFLRPIGDSFRVNLLPKINFLKARALASSNNPLDWKKGLDLIDSALKMSKTAYMFHTKGVLFQNKSRFFTAASLFDSALKYSPNWTYALYNIATNYYQIQEYEKSIEFFKKILDKDSSYSRIYSWLGYNYETIVDNKISNYSTVKNYREAIDYNFKALEVDSANTYAYLNLGRIYFKIRENQKSNEELVKFFLTKGGIRYGDSQCLTWLGKLYDRQGLLDSAEYFYEKAWELNNFDTAALENYVSFLFRQGEKEKADSLFQIVLEKTKDTQNNIYDYKFLSKYCSFVFRAKSPDAADKIFQEIISTNTEDPSIFTMYSKQWESIDSVNKAKDIIRIGLAAIPTSPSLNYAMARLNLKYNNGSKSWNIEDSSLYFLKKSYELAPLSSVTTNSLGKTYLISNNFDSAKLYLNKADSLNEFVNFTVSFDREIESLGDSAIKKKKYSEAFSYYAILNKISEIQDKLVSIGKQYESANYLKFQSNLKIARLFYLNNKLDSAQFFCGKSGKYLSNFNDFEDGDSIYFEMQRNLMGLIEIEKKNKKAYKQAINIFDELDQNLRQAPDYLEQAVAFYCLGSKKVAIRLAQSSKEETRVKTFKRIVDSEGISYSSFFVQNLKKLIEEIGHSFFKK
ncbi:caspase family protein [Ferruginibacter paludis]|uniref:caspase family protein n=1 Tax=Ferruginibacter paludis TaxID=1310417 RepID=UPI0025B43B88|nr:caspase family protein [Ferruginibacter paludis]MDN3658669.1 caspase family protein [Ferruginibacter paludis]